MNYKIFLGLLWAFGCAFFCQAGQVPSQEWYKTVSSQGIVAETGIDYNIVNQVLYQFKDAESSCSWKRYYHVIPELINAFDLRVGCEVGVAYGMHSQTLLETTNLERLYSVDPFRHFDVQLYDDPMNFEQKKFDVFHYLVAKRLAQFGLRSLLMRMASIEAIEQIKNNELDFVFIDANHSYQSVHDDLRLWYQKVRPGGFIIGDDYDHPNFPGLKKAVDEFGIEMNLVFNRRADVPEIYWFQKPYNVGKQHFLTFIMPCYNCEKTVIESLNSIYEQHLAIPWEIVCTDDGSTDNTRLLLLDYQRTHPELKIFMHEKNKGGGAARNTCVAHAQGDLIFCLDSDNVLVENSVQQLVDLIDQKNVDAAVFNEIRFFKDNFVVSHSWFYEADNNICDIHHVMKGYITPPSSGNYLFTKASYDIVGGYPENAGALDAFAFGFKQLAHGLKIAILPHSFYWHRIVDDGYWLRESHAKRLNYYAIFKEFPELFTKESYAYLDQCEKMGSEFYTALAHVSLIPEKALNYLFRARCLVHENRDSEARQAYRAAIESGAVSEYVEILLQNVSSKKEL